MTDETRILELRARDFWTSLFLIALSLFFLWKTSAIPLFSDQMGGVSGIHWYDSAAIVPLGIFSSLLLLSVVLLANAIRSGGAAQAFSAIGIGWETAAALRFICIGLCLFAYIAGLVPRVDFIIASGLLITALIFGFHGNRLERMLIAAGAMLIAAAYALVIHLPRAEWNAHDDDLVALGVWALLTALVMWRSKEAPLLRIVPLVAILTPFILVCAMAFGFRQNVPARTGLLFKQIEYHYYVTLRPIWSK